MIVIPIATFNHEHDAIIIALDDENVGRMKKADPVQVRVCELPGSPMVINPILLIAFESAAEIERRMTEHGIDNVLAYLQRGARYAEDGGNLYDATDARLIAKDKRTSNERGKE